MELKYCMECRVFSSAIYRTDFQRERKSCLEKPVFYTVHNVMKISAKMSHTSIIWLAVSPLNMVRFLYAMALFGLFTLLDSCKLKIHNF